jgi:hypothetical protein
VIDDEIPQSPWMIGQGNCDVGTLCEAVIVQFVNLADADVYCGRFVDSRISNPRIDRRNSTVGESSRTSKFGRYAALP